MKDKVAIITGGAKGSARLIAWVLPEKGLKWSLPISISRRAKVLEETIIKQGLGGLAVNTDVSKVAEVDDMVKKTMERFGRIDILFNNAGKFQRNPAVRAPVWEMDPAEWEKVIAVNLTGVFLCCRAVIPHMIKQKSGKIINVASSLAFFGTPNFPIMWPARVV